MLTVYDSASYDTDIANQRYRHRERYSEEEWRLYLEAVFQEYSRFGKELVVISSQTGTKIVVSNWEAANDAPKDQMWYLEGGQDGPYLEYLKSRLSGLRQGIAKGLEEGFKGRVETAFEFTLLWEGMDPNPWDEIPPRTISDFEIGVRELKEFVDVWSYSSWASVWYLEDTLTTETMVEYNRQSMETAFRRMRYVCGGCRIIVGEVGYLYGFPESSAVLRALIETALEQGAEKIFSWVLYDQPREKWVEFGSFDETGRLTETGDLLRRMTQEIPKGRRGRGSRTAPGGGRGR